MIRLFIFIFFDLSRGISHDYLFVFQYGIYSIEIHSVVSHSQDSVQYSISRSMNGRKIEWKWKLTFAAWKICAYLFSVCSLHCNVILVTPVWLSRFSFHCLIKTFFSYFNSNWISLSLMLICMNLMTWRDNMRSDVVRTRFFMNLKCAITHSQYTQTRVLLIYRCMDGSWITDINRLWIVIEM